MKKVLIGILLFGVLSLSGCKNNAYEEQYAEISDYNEMVTSTVSEFKNTESVARELEEDVINFVTFNSISEKLYKSIKVEQNLDKFDDEPDELYKLRNASQIIDNFEDTIIYEGYNEYQENKDISSDVSESSMSKKYKYGKPYVWDKGYYSTVSSQYIEQFLVVYFEDTTDRIIVQAYWQNEKLLRVLISE